MTIKNIMIAVAGVAAIGGVCFLAALVRETGKDGLKMSAVLWMN